MNLNGFKWIVNQLWRAAMCRGVALSISSAFGFAPARNKSSTTFSCEFRTAVWSGLHLSISCALIFAPFFNKIPTALSWPADGQTNALTQFKLSLYNFTAVLLNNQSLFLPFFEATCKGVHLSVVSSFTFTPLRNSCSMSISSPEQKWKKHDIEQILMTIQGVFWL